MKINEKLLKACRTREIPHADLLALMKPIKGTTREERLSIQNRIAEEIERKYPYRPGKEPKEEK